MTENEIGTIVVESAIAVHQEFGPEELFPLRLSSSAGEENSEFQQCRKGGRSYLAPLMATLGVQERRPGFDFTDAHFFLTKFVTISI